MAENSVGSASAAVLKRACFKKVGLFDEDLPCSQDYDLWIRISKEFLFEYVPEPLFKYSIHPNKISTNLEALAKGLEIMAEKYRDYPLSYYRENISILGSCAVCPAIFMGEGKRFAERSVCFQYKSKDM